MPRLIYNKDNILLDWKSGEYTIRNIADKHKISRALVGQIVKGVEKTIEPLIDKQMQINQELAIMDRQEVDKFRQVVDEKSKHLDLITNATHLNINRMMAKFKDKDAQFPVMEHKLIQSTIKDARESLLGKEQAPAVINQTITIPQEELSERLNRLNELTRVVQG